MPMQDLLQLRPEAWPRWPRVTSGRVYLSRHQSVQKSYHDQPRVTSECSNFVDWNNAVSLGQRSIRIALCALCKTRSKEKTLSPDTRLIFFSTSMETGLSSLAKQRAGFMHWVIGSSGDRKGADAPEHFAHWMAQREDLSVLGKMLLEQLPCPIQALFCKHY